jgi:phosphomethylpyrimidine synthase
MNQKACAQKGEISPQMHKVAELEKVAPEVIRQGILEGTIVISQNKRRTNVKPLGIGKNLRTKINANLGTSKDLCDLNLELQKLKIAVEAGADAVMDLSTGGDIDGVRKVILEHSPVALGTVPIYQAAIEAGRDKGHLSRMSAEDILRVIERHAADGVDFVTVHCGVTQESVGRLKAQGRLMDVVSRGGAFLVEWMIYNKKENPLYEYYDDLLKIALKYDLTLSLGDGLRPGALADATDRAQIQELITLGELTQRAWDAGVQVIIEGPGHVPLDQIQANVLLEKRLCQGAPFYVLGPLVTDVAPGYDHITGAIGGAIAAMAGADFLCYVTPSEHLRLPTLEDVKEGVIASKIAAHAADIAKGIPGAMEWDIAMSRARKALDWEQQIALSVDPKRAREFRQSAQPVLSDVCTMCGEYCAIKTVGEYLKKK